MSAIRKMANWGDLIEYLGPDMSLEIFTHLDDPSDLARICAVSRSWHHFVIVNNLFKLHCLRRFWEVPCVSHLIEADNAIEPLKLTTNSSLEWERLRRNHRVYAFLARGLTSTIEDNCISGAISASSTDNYPEESVQNTLEPGDRVQHRASYWSSKGESDPGVPETLVYRLIAKLCIITDIYIQPFQAFFQYGLPIYSAKAVRFRMGHHNVFSESDCESTSEFKQGVGLMDSNYVWTYTSPEFPMAQSHCLQKFHLPEPVLCIGGILQVELLGRVQSQEMDGLYYICVSHVRATGRPLSSAFDVDIVDSSGKCTLMYYSEVERNTTSSNQAKKHEGGAPSRLHSLTARLLERGMRSWEQMISNAILGAGVVIESDDSDDELAL